MADAVGPRCPNHGVGLVECDHGVGICPISGCRFTYTAEEGEQKRKLKLNALGQLVEEQTFITKQVDGGTGG